jgi:hypothetical protein
MFGQLNFPLMENIWLQVSYNYYFIQDQKMADWLFTNSFFDVQDVLLNFINILLLILLINNFFCMLNLSYDSSMNKHNMYCEIVKVS